LTPRTGPTAEGFEIPVPLREYPLPPTLVRQHDSPTYAPDALPSKGFVKWCGLARQWNLDVYYSILPIDQDLVYATVTYNNVDPRKNSTVLQGDDAESFEPDLVMALVIYGQLRTKVWNALQGLRKGPTAANPKSIEWMAKLCGWIVDGFDRSAELSADALPTPEDRAWVDEIFDPDTGSQEIEVKRYSGAIADKVLVSPTMPDGSVIDHVPVPGHGDGGKTLYRIRYVPPEGQETDGTIWCHRKLSFIGLGVTEIENGWAGVELTRNERLSSIYETNPAFVYRTPVVRFGGHRTPSLERFAPIDISDDKQRTMAEHVSVLLKNALDVRGKNPYGRLSVEFDVGWGYDNERLLQAQSQGDSAAVMTRAPFPKKRVVANSIALDSNGGSLELDGFAASLAARLEAWRTGTVFANDAGGKPIGSIVFDITLYAHIKGEDKPTFRVLNCRLPLRSIN